MPLLQQAQLLYLAGIVVTYVLHMTSFMPNISNPCSVHTTCQSTEQLGLGPHNQQPLQSAPKHGQVPTAGRPHQPIRTRRPLSRPQVLLLHFRPWLQSLLSQQVRPMVPQSTVDVAEKVAAELFFVLSKFLPLAVFVTLRGLNLAAHGDRTRSQL